MTNTTNTKRRRDEVALPARAGPTEMIARRTEHMIDNVVEVMSKQRRSRRAEPETEPVPASTVRQRRLH